MKRTSDIHSECRNSMRAENLFLNLSEINEIRFCSFGVKIGIHTDEKRHLIRILESLTALLPDNFRFINKAEVDFHFYLKSSSKNFEFYRNEELIISGDKNEKNFINYFLSYLRLTIAEHAISRVFIHAGVVVWNEKAIILPAHSYGGKTTLVSELIKNGAEYYSDEYAVLDEKGLVHPFPKMLSVRGIVDEYLQKDVPVETFGGTAGIKPIPAGLVLFTKFEKNAKWKPEILTTGQGVFEILSHTIPIRYNPKFSLEVLNKTLSGARILKSKRGEATDISKTILQYV